LRGGEHRKALAYGCCSYDQVQSKIDQSAEWLTDRIELDVKAGRFEKGRRRWYLGRLLLIQTRFGGRLFRISSVTRGRAGGGRTSGTYL